MRMQAVRKTVTEENKVVHTTSWVASCSSFFICVAIIALETATGEANSATSAG